MKALFFKMFSTSKIFKRWQLISYLTIIGLLLFSINTTFADSAVTCKKPENETEKEKKQTTFCFFSLNNPLEVKKLEDKYEDNPNVEVKEFYQEEDKSVKESFKKMMETQICDALVISGHHTGYFAGNKSISSENDSQALELDFMEEMACENECDEWFSNVNSLFLMGCQTVKTPELLEHEDNTDTADSETIRVIAGEFERESSQAIHMDQHIMINQAYSSTLDENNKMSHRYLRMFPNSSLYGWGGKAPGEQSGSQNSLPNFINQVESINKTSSDTDDTDDVLNFIGFMNSQNRTCKEYTAGKWVNHWPNSNYTNPTDNPNPTTCYLDFQGTEEEIRKKKERFKGYHKTGCDLTRAIKEDNKDNIISSINDILTPDDDDTTGEKIKANFNRLMSLITNKENKDKPWYADVVNKLKDSTKLRNTLRDELLSKKVGFTRKADYLYFYKEIGSCIDPENCTDIEKKWEESKKEISGQYLTQLQTAFDEIKNNTSNQEIQRAHRYSLFYSIAQNKLGKWLSENDPGGFKTLRDQFVNSDNEWDQVQGHFLSYLGQISEEGISEKDMKAARTAIEEKKATENWLNGYMCKHEPYVAKEIDSFKCQ